MILLDTHVAIWVTTDDSGIGKQSRRLLERASKADDLAVSAISYWEMGMLVAKRRLRRIRSPAEQRALISASGIQEVPLTGDIAIIAAELDGLHGDPADRLIVATAIFHNATLVTADRALLSWRHSLRRQDAAL